MKFYQFFRYWQHVAARAAGPDLPHKTEIRQKIPLQNSFSPSVAFPSVTNLAESAIDARDSCARAHLFATPDTLQLDFFV